MACVSVLNLLSGISLSTTGSTSELYGADNSVLSVHELKTIEVEFADLESLTETKVINVDDNAFGDFGIDSLYADFLH